MMLAGSVALNYGYSALRLQSLLNMRRPFLVASDVEGPALERLLQVVALFPSRITARHKCLPFLNSEAASG